MAWAEWPGPNGLGRMVKMKCSNTRSQEWNRPSPKVSVKESITTTRAYNGEGGGDKTSK